MKKIISLGLGILLTLIACTNQADENSPSFEETIDKTPSIAVTPTLRKTNTPRPTFTASTTPEPTPTIPQATIAAMTTLESLAEIFPELKSNWGASISPSGTWAEFYIFAKNQNILRLIEVNGSKQWEINFYDIYGSRSEYSDKSVGSVGTVYWSKDGAYVYLEPYPEWDGPGLWFGSGATLIRFNLKNGTWADLNVGNSWSISPNEKYIVYSANDGIHLRKFFDGSEKVFPVPEKFEIFGKFVWSPENDKFAFTATYGDWYDGKTGFSAFLVDVKSSSINTLFEDDLRMLYPQEWTDTEKIILYQYQSYDVYSFDLATKEIALIATP